MTREEKEIFALQAYPPDLEGNGMTWPFIDRNEPYRNKLIAALESMEANGMEISIGGKIRRDNTLSKKILEEVQPQGLDEAAKEAGLEYAPKQEGEAIDANGDVYVTDDVEWPSRCGFIQGFKTGAKWLAGQGYTVEETVYFERLCDENRIMVDLGWGEPERGGFNPGDKVIVQIRKKEG